LWVRWQFCELQWRIFCVFMYPCKWYHASCQWQNDLALGEKLQKPTATTNPASCVPWLKDVDLCRFVTSKPHQLTAFPVLDWTLQSPERDVWVIF
jgi:hypothetical protein